MNKNILIVLGGAVLAAVLVAVLIQVMVGGNSSTMPSEGSVMVLVAARDLKSSVETKDGDFMWQEWPEDKLFRGAMVRKEDDQSPDEVLDGRFARDINQGEPVKRDAMLKAKTGNFVAASLAPGERAISLKVKPESIVAGFIGPGTYVDVILTYQEKIQMGRETDPLKKQMVELNIDKLATETILQNIRVLAIDQTTEREFDDDVEIGKTVTLAVSIRDAEKIALADKMGTITLSMRAIGDDSTIDRSEVPVITDVRMTNIRDELQKEYLRILGLKSGKKSSSASSTPLPSIKRGSGELKIISGSSVQEAKF
ncbi:MAG: Flp pilus assembly protein CpaB [Alphaproteobacteria bacterium]|nr:Flp pilus assembly protein CpaB [Alphaproteobacteria bacterium]